MIRLQILAGARAGTTLTFTGQRITIGRHPDADLAFDPHGDPLVSLHHAMIWTDGPRWFLRDLESRNGTYRNGARIPPGDTHLADGDRLAFGSEHAMVELRFLDTPAAEESPTARISIAVAHQTRWLRRTLSIAGIALAAGTALSIYTRQNQHHSWERERTRLQQRIDSIADAGEASIRSLEAELRQLDQALASSRAEVESLTTDLERARARGDQARIALLQRQLQAATLAAQRHQLAAALDFRAIERANRRAVARIYVEAPDGAISTGTAFAVRADGTLLTNRHVVAGPRGTATPRRLAVQFSDSEQVWPTRILAVAEDLDLALIKVDNILGAVPTIRAFNLRADTIPRGAPVASIGFPLGGEDDDAPTSRPARPARPLIFAGIVSGTPPGGIEFLGYGAVGASGSPIFDANGEVVAILYGGRQGEAGHISLGISAAAALDLLRTVR